MREWDIDGLKLDFLDNFYIRKDHPAPWKEGIDFSRVEDALLSFLGQIKEELVSEKTDVMNGMCGFVNAMKQRQQFFWAEEKGMYEILQSAGRGMAGRGRGYGRRMASAEADLGGIRRIHGRPASFSYWHRNIYMGV